MKTFKSIAIRYGSHRFNNKRTYVYSEVYIFFLRGLSSLYHFLLFLAALANQMDILIHIREYELYQWILKGCRDCSAIPIRYSFVGRFIAMH